MQKIKTSNDKFFLRFATKKDTSIILDFITQLAIYEEMLDDVKATPEGLEESLFTRNAAEVIIGEYDGIPVGFMLFFGNFSTFLGKPGIYLEDLFINPNMRHKGLGKIMLKYLAALTIERDCGRLEWACLDWNEPSIKFYKGLGAKSLDEWTTYRVTGDALKKLADG